MLLRRQSDLPLLAHLHGLQNALTLDGVTPTRLRRPCTSFTARSNAADTHIHLMAHSHYSLAGERATCICSDLKITAKSRRKLWS